MKKYVVILGMFVVLSGCLKDLQPIVYGTDACHFCSMTIVDKQHAATFMTNKGKTFKFDASECMLNHIKEMDRTTIAVFKVNDYNDPGALIDATKGTYLISKNIPSPMGAFLTGFENQEEAEKAQAENSGTLFTWMELEDKFGINN